MDYLNIKTELERLQKEYECVQIIAPNYRIAGYTYRSDEPVNERTLIIKTASAGIYTGIDIRDAMTNIAHDNYNEYYVGVIAHDHCQLYPSHDWEDGEILALQNLNGGFITMEFYK